MNLAKSIFISLYLTLLGLGSLNAIWAMVSFGDKLPWVWVLTALAPGLGFFAWLYLTNVARTGYGSVVIWGSPSFALAGALVTQSLTTATAGWIGGAGLLCGLIYVLWYSRYGERSSTQLKVGAKLPNFQVADEKGQVIDVGALQGPLLLIFYRGNWCPLCTAQIREVAGRYQELEQRGVKVLAISPQPAADSASLAKRMAVNIQFCVDKDNQAAKQLGLEAKNGLPLGLQVFGYDSDTVMPTVLITDADHRILFADLTDNYRVRPEPDTFFEVLEQAGVVSR